MPAVPTWPGLLNRLIEGADLARDETTWAMDEIMSGGATQAQIAGFAVALRAKGETADEIAGMAEGMLSHARPLRVDGPAVDVVGTGGDGAHTVNISTMASITTAAAGVPVVKHGNRSSSSKCGTADVLEELGVAIELPPEGVAACVAEVGIGFCFAPVFHPAFRMTGPPRRELGIPTAFNVLGPLTNPARIAAGLVGCANARMAPILAAVFAGRGASVLVVRGDDDLDEITTTTTTRAWVATGGTVREEVIDPARLGIAPAAPADLKGGEAPFNAQVVRDLVAGKPGPVRDAVLLNAAGAIAAFHGFGSDLHADLAAGLEQAARALDSGAAAALLERWTTVSQRLAGD
ncbi:anthranilate phosphoribosyltransferase [Actinokineospora pegani]|uniref:anthranilate phosphoribosyltransferase n=1 Tax=Actinokineospora pegani TaxID=2654637 RepID=UPI0012EA13D2|nr:anthranilate phosphoribosyltransferase [Actinokineospora pegani]